jgi:hypothetical protein
VEEATSVSGPDFERMSKDVVDAWFDSFEDISPLPSVVGPVSDAVACPASGAPMALHGLTDVQHARRSDVIRDALSSDARERTARVGPRDAERRSRSYATLLVCCGRFGNQAESAIGFPRRNSSNVDPFTRPSRLLGDLGERA